MSKIILATIPHTGTLFFKDLLESHGLPVRAIHLTDDGLEKAGEAVKDGSVLITTWRNIEDVKRSWLKRGRIDNLSNYLENWYNLEAYEPFVVSVDSRREERLRVLGAVLRVSFRADWEPVNATLAEEVVNE